MNPQEKMAIQNLLLEELRLQQDNNPSLLLDVLLAEQGYAFVLTVLTKQVGITTQNARMATQLLQSFKTTVSPPAPTALPPRDEHAA